MSGGYVDENYLLPFSDPDTGASAARALGDSGNAENQARTTLAFLRRRGRTGATDDETYYALPELFLERRGSQTRARNSLVKFGLAEWNGEKRRSVCDKPVKVWTATTRPTATVWKEGRWYWSESGLEFGSKLTAIQAGVAAGYSFEAEINKRSAS